DRSASRAARAARATTWLLRWASEPRTSASVAASWGRPAASLSACRASATGSRFIAGDHRNVRAARSGDPASGGHGHGDSRHRRALAVMSVLGQSLTNIILVVGLVIAPGTSRVVRGTVLTVKQHTFIDAAQALGASPGRIVARHVLPNVFAPILVIATVWLGNAIVIEAALSFLGLGTPPPTPTWGAMLSGEGRRNLETAPYLAIFPGVAISLVVL